MPRILHTSDFHINALRKFPDFYLQRVRSTLNEISLLAKKEEVDYIVMAGDVYHRLDILHEERNIFSEWLRKIKVPVIGISGNHDKRTVEIGDTSLAYLSKLPVNHVIHDGPPYAVEMEDCTFILFPYEKWDDYEFYLILESRLESQVNYKPIVVVMHEAISGCTIDGGFEIPAKIHLDSELLEKFPLVTYWALGDMHSKQSLAPNVWYSGAPHQTNFGENRGKGVLIVDTDDPTNPEFFEIDSMPLEVVTGPYYPDLEWDPKILFKYVPDHVLPANAFFPSNVIVEEKFGSVRKNEDTLGQESMVGIFYGLEDTLLRLGLKSDLVPVAVKLAHKSAKELRISVVSEKEQDKKVTTQNA